MKKRSLLLGLIFLISSFAMQGQIVTKYQQGFEATGETYGYTVTQGSANVVTTLSSSGERALKLSYSPSGMVEIILDTLDFTDNGQFQYFYLEFMHICDVDPLTAQNADEVATVDIRNALDPNAEWVNLDGSDHYDVTWGGGSSDYAQNSSFSERSYAQWRGTTPTNAWWKRERFKLHLRIQQLPLNQRKMLIRFRLFPKHTAGSSNEGWYLDNISVKCSPNSMLLPIMTMTDYPDLMNYPNSRGTRVAAKFTTPLTEGMCNDSVYVVYQLGRSADILRKTMTPISGSPGEYETYIPFCGYDTIVYWRMIGKDNSLNHNETSFPSDLSGWQQYRSVRGKASMMPISTNFAPTNTLPFPNKGSHKSEIVYDSAEMNVNYKAAAITQIRYPVAANVNNSNRNRVQIKMRNIDNTFEYTSSNIGSGTTNAFSSEFQKVVYDSSLSITQNANTNGVIYLQDTFFYAGKGLMITFTNYNTNNDPTAVSVRTFPVPSSNNSTRGSVAIEYPADIGFNPFTSEFFNSGTRTTQRPNFTFNAVQNAPLLYDCGVGGYIHPNDSTPANAVGNNDVVVSLTNYGALPINNVRIYYSVDNGTHQYYDWSGTLAGGASTQVTISTTQQYPAGYHEMLAWVDDSVTSSGARYRDHEPLNDTLWTRFISCDGPMSGVRYVGGSTPDYANLDQLLYALSQCGVNGPLTVKMASGVYGVYTFPVIPGTSESNYIQFEPIDAGNTVLFNAPTNGSASTVNAIINLQQANHIRFNRINFGSNATQSRATYLVRLGTNSTGCEFHNCIFTEGQGNGAAEDFMTASALLYSGGADSLVVSNCTFTRGTAGLSLVGPAQDNMARGSYVFGNNFENQGVNSMIIRNQIGTVVDSNTCNRVYANSSYCILLQDCSGATRVTRNAVYVTSGASCIGATNFFGSANGYAVVANNMLVSDDDGLSNMLTTPLNIITANYAKVLFNSVKLTAPTRSGIAAATFGGGTLSNSYFYNNIVGCYDTVNFAFNFIPTEDSVNYIGYNIYYSRGPLLNKYDGINCLTFANWLTHLPSDGNSQNVNPAFLGTTAMDLRSYSQNVKSHAIPFAEVDNDIFGTPRDAVAPCLGAFEFTSLPYDFEIQEFLEPYTEYCVAPSSAPLRVVIKNSGINPFDPASQSMTLHYSRAAVPGVTSGIYGTVPVNITIPASDTVTWNTGATIPFPTVGTRDTTYRLYVWLSSTIDPNPANDTNFTTVLSHYHYPAPNTVNVNSNYGDSATVTVTQGLQTWYGNVYSSGISHQSEVYWYDSPESVDPIWRGHSITIPPLYTDDTLYIRQSRDYGLVRITEVQFKQNQPGVTYPMPMFMNSATALAVELTNVGDYPLNMLGDTIVTVGATSALNKKKYAFPDITLQPGQTIVLQYRQNLNNIDSTRTLGTANLSPNQQVEFGLLYKHQNVIEDAVAFNGITTHANWTSYNIPNTVWLGAGISLPDSMPTAGVFRTAWPSSPTSLTTSSLLWQAADNNNRMTLGTTNQNLIRFVDNGCLGDVAPVYITLVGLPNVDVAIEDLALDDGCDMAETPITVNVYNRGSQPTGQMILNYKVQGYPQYAGQAIELQTCSDTISAGLAAQTSMQHTFSVVPDFTVASASVDFDVVVWATQNSADGTSFNDTLRLSVTSMFTPDTPNVVSYDTVSYDGVLHLTSVTPPSDSLAWYDSNMQPLDTTNVYVTDHIYADDTFYVSAFGAKINQYHVGSMTSLSNATAYPSPYNPNKKYVKEQYLFLAEDLIAAGHTAGPILTLSFYLDTVMGAGAFTLTDYTISLGATSQTTFTGNNNWQSVAQYYHADSLALSNSNKGWIFHALDSAFIWNGVDNIVVQVTRTCDPQVTTGARTRYTNGGANKVLYKNDNSNSVVDFTGNGSRSANRPDIRFGFVDYGCEGPAKPVYITVVDVPNSDASLSFESDGPGSVAGGQAFTSCDTTDINVVLRNMGGQPFSSYQIDYWIDTLHGVYSGTTPVQPRTNVTLTVAHHLFTPGRHTLRMAVTLQDDTVQSNDTIQRTLSVRFCGGHYAVGPVNGLYADFTTAIDTLNNAGIDGPVVFDVEPGTYVEQVVLGSVDGISSTNTVTFNGAGNSPDSVVLRYAPVNNSNYVLRLYGSEYITFSNLTVLARGASNYSNAVVVDSSNQIHFTNVVLRVKGGLNNVNASCLVVGEHVTALYVNNSVVDSGYYSVRSMVGTLGGSAGIYLSNNTFQNFGTMGIYLRKCDDVYIVGNQVRSGASSNGKALTGILLAQHTGPATIERNNVVLSDAFNGGKQGIKIIDVNGANATRSLVSNNMCAMNGTRSTGLTSAGIWIDSSTWVNVYYNSCNVYAGNDAQGATTRAMNVGTTSMEIYVMNNLFQNLSAGYAYYVNNPINIGNSNYNDYYSNAQDRLAYWGGEMPTFDTLRQVNHMDAQSMNQKAHFESNDDLHMTLGTFCERAQYNTMVPLDIDGLIRPQIPSPCMGAHEFVRKNHNIAVVDIVKPKIKEYPTQTTGFTDNVESDTLWVVVELMNDGTSTESNLKWWAEVKNVSPTLSTTQRTITEMLPQATVIDSNFILMPIGIIDTQIVVVHFPLVNDSSLANNDMEQVFFLDPAYNLMAEQALILDTGCRLQNTPIGIKVKNVGRKTYPAQWIVPAGFEAVLQTANVNVSTLPTIISENIPMPLDLGVNESAILNFSNSANIYPTGIDKDIVIRARVWCSHEYDQKPLNDTTNYVTHQSFYTPNMPVGIDLHIPYATWDTIFASQTDTPPGASAIHRPIRWHLDTTGTAVDEPFYAPTNYNQSTWWETPQYFRDTVYYLSCLSVHGGNTPATCTSYYNPVHVYINPRVPVDMAVLDVVEPVGNRVYMTRDSVKISLINYGNQTVSNIPVVYQLYDHTNTLLQEVRETCSHSVAPDEVYVYTFDSLLYIPNWSTTNAYHLRVWTDMVNENVRLNDTLRNLVYFNAIPDDAYQTTTVGNKTGMDITRVAFSSLDNRVSPAGHDYINFVNASRQLGAISTPQTLDTISSLKDYGGSVAPQSLGELRALHLVKGTVDTMIVESINGDKPDDRSTSGWLSVWIDIDRDGTFLWNPVNPGTDSADYSYPLTEIFYHDTIVSGSPKKFLFTLPEDIRTGYMRMRVVVDQGAYAPKNISEGISFGSVQDYLLYIEDEPENTDLCVSRIVSPTEQHIGGHTGYGSDTIQVAVKFQLANKGSQTISSADIEYTFSDGDGVHTETTQWSGNLMKGQSAEVELPARLFAVGVTELRIVAKAVGDTLAFNDTLYYYYYRPAVKTLVWDDDFEGDFEWFVPQGNSMFSVNLWQRGRSHKPNIMACVSDSSILATNINGTVNAAVTGNVSYAYTPIFDISVIRPDTLELWVARAMTTGHLMRLEYYNYEGVWTVVGSGNDTLWYTSNNGWDTVSSGYGYSLYRFPLSSIGSDFLQRLQFRLVYKAGTETQSCDGAAIDDFVVGRMKRPIDVSVIAITYPVEPRFGETIKPRVIVKNNGLDTINNFMLAYRPYGMPLAITGTFSNDGGLEPGETALYEFPTPFIVRDNFPDTFQICAFTTVQMDMYRDNDTVCQDFYLAPMLNDMGAVEFLSPLDHIVAGDSVEVTVRLRNYGVGTVSDARVTYIYNDSYEVSEDINFQNMLGRDLGTFEYFNYTFKHKFRSSMGTMHLTCYVKSDGDIYPFNDTVNKSINGLSAITDLRAREIVVDSSDHNVYFMQVVIDNVGARAANDFKIGYWYYNDLSTYSEVIYHSDEPLPALQTLYYVFPDSLPNQLSLYSRVTAFVHAENDNDRTNDTTTTIASQYVDLRPVRVMVEENRYDSCQVRIEIENVGNVVTNPTRITAYQAVINGEQIRANNQFLSIMPGQSVFIDFPKKILKSPTRTYEGTGSIRQCEDDHHPENNQTTRIEVVNYLDLPIVEEANGIVLEQNYPNPFKESTRIDFFLPEGGDVRFFVMDELGRLVHQSVKSYGSGNQSIDFSQKNLTSGVYYYGIEVNGERLMRKMVFKK